MTKLLRTLLTRHTLRVNPLLNLQPVRAATVPSSQATLLPTSVIRPSLCVREPSFSVLRRTLTTTTSKQAKKVSVTFTDRDGDVQTVEAKVGDTLLEVAKEFDIDVEGACEGTLSCSTCHLIVDPEWFDKIPDPLTEEEQDMLDLAYAPTETSRLGCQIMVTKALDGLKVTVPSATRDIRNT